MNRKINYSILAVVFWFALFLAWEWWQSFPRVRLTPISIPESKEAKIDSLLIQSLTQFLIPGMALGLIEDNKVTYLKAFGYGNLETKDTLTLQSGLPVASISKIFTALSLANFALGKEMSLDTAFNSLLPRNKKLAPEFDDISLRDLLEHTSGLSDRGKLKNILVGEEMRHLSKLPETLNSPRENKETQYADINFDLIGYVLENCAKVPFDSMIHQNTLIPGGMERSYFLSEEPSDSFPIVGYKNTFLWKRLQSTKLKTERYPSPSSGLIVTAEDLSKALLHLCRSDMGNFAEELRWLKGESETPAGFQKITLNDQQFVGHFGEQGGFSAILFYSSELEIGFFLLTNAKDNYDFRQKIPSEILKIIAQ